MKPIYLCMTLIFSFAVFAQEIESEIVEVAQINEAIEVVEASENKSVDVKERNLLKKIGNLFRDLKKEGTVKRIGKKALRGLGKASTAVATETARPFIFAASGARGLFSKLDSEDSKTRTEIYSFYLDNEKELNSLYKDKSIYTNLIASGENTGHIASDYQVMVENLLKQKVLATVKDILAEINFNPEIAIDGEIAKKLSDASSLEEMALMLTSLDTTDLSIYLDIDFEKLNNQTIHAKMKCNNLGVLTPYVDVANITDVIAQTVISGENIGGEDLMSMIDTSIIDRLMAFIESFIETEDGKIFKNKKLVSEMGESVAALTAQYAVPSLMMGSLGGAFAITSAVATSGAIASSAVCLSKKNQEKIAEDADLRNFCSYVLMRASQKIAKSKANGFIKGQNLRKNILGVKANLKNRKNKMDECLEIRGKTSRKECRLNVKAQRIIQLNECIDSGKSKRECARERRENLRVELNLM